MNVPFVDLKIQFASLKKEILLELEKVCENAAFILGPFVQRFEEAFASYIGSKHCIGLNSGTAAVQLAIQAFIQPGDEVIVPPNTFIATTEAITAAGGKIRFVDIDEGTYNVDPGKLSDAITSRTRAVIPVHLYGQPANMDAILEIAHYYDLFVIEDAAQAHGAFYKDRRVGSIGHAAAFSFYPGKNLGAYGEAGAVTTNSDEAARFVRMYRDHGSAEKYLHEFEGYNMRMEGFQAAVLKVKLKYLEEWNEARRKNARLYQQLLRNVEEVILPIEAEYGRHVYHLYVIRVKDRQGLQQFLAEKGIATGYHYLLPLHLQKAYAHLGYKKGDFPVTEKVMSEIISLPMYPELSEEQIAYVAEKVMEFVKK
ncbi:MAG: DegT/DnrJ/EryC1/StrS family aminotransferase [Calditrichia bacterium]